MTQADPIPITQSQPWLRELLEKTGYGLSDLLSLSITGKIALMRNGGKYQMVRGEIEHLAGPSPDPNERM